jgi:hypothetical protein
MPTDRNRRRETEKRDKKEDKMNEHGDIEIDIKIDGKKREKFRNRVQCRTPLPGKQHLANVKYKVLTFFAGKLFLFVVIISLKLKSN